MLETQIKQVQNPKVSVANIVYQIQGTGTITVFFKNDTEKKIELSRSWVIMV